MATHGHVLQLNTISHNVRGGRVICVRVPHRARVRCASVSVWTVSKQEKCENQTLHIGWQKPCSHVESVNERMGEVCDYLKEQRVVDRLDQTLRAAETAARVVVAKGVSVCRVES
jgi:hypothetical protein